MGFRISDPQRNVMDLSTQMSPHFFLCFSDIPKSCEIFIILVCLLTVRGRKMMSWVVRMSQHDPPSSCTCFTGWFVMQLLGHGHRRHPYFTTGFGRKHLYSPCFCSFVECQWHIMNVKCLILGTHEPNACKLMSLILMETAQACIMQHAV